MRNKTLNFIYGLSNLESDVLRTSLTECYLDKFSLILGTNLKNLPTIYLHVHEFTGDHCQHICLFTFSTFPVLVLQDLLIVAVCVMAFIMLGERYV